jgi:hypothetical protein
MTVLCHLQPPDIGSMNLDLSDEKAAAITRELDDITRNDSYPFSERIRTPA